MLEVSKEAIEKLRELLAAQGGADGAIRIAVMGGGAGGPGLGLVFDDPGPSDILEQQEGIPLLIDRQLLTYCRTISIEFRESTGGSGCPGGGGGFVITPEQPL